MKLANCKKNWRDWKFKQNAGKKRKENWTIQARKKGNVKIYLSGDRTQDPTLSCSKNGNKDGEFID
jgi:hypothetical protein